MLPATTALLALMARIPAAFAVKGNATAYYSNNNGGACSLQDYALPDGVYAATISGKIWDNSQACGGCISVTNQTGSSVTAMIVNKCDSCGLNNVALESAGYSQIAPSTDPAPNAVPVDWNYVDCPIQYALYVKSSGGSNEYYYALQVLNGTRRTESVAVSPQGGEYAPLERQSYNYFTTPQGGLGKGPYTIMLTSVDGDVVLVPNMPAQGGATMYAQGNY